MSTITIDPRPAGTGKTTSDDGNYGKIDKDYTEKLINVNNKQKYITLAKHDNASPYLIASPSIILQDQYSQKYKSQITINSTNSTNVVADTTNAMVNNNHIINITHTCLTMLPDCDIASKYNLIIDEAISNVIDMKSIEINSIQCIDYKWDQHFEVIDNELMELELKQKKPTSEYFEIKLINRNDDNLTGKLYKDITDPNYRYFISVNEYKIMMGLSQSDKKHFTIGRILKPDVITKFKSVHISSAAFYNTAMYHWLKYNNIEFTYTHQFKPHVGNIHIHYAIPKHGNSVNKKTGKVIKYRWSNSKRNADKSILKSHHDYVTSNANSPNILVLRNNGETQSINTEYKLTHNIHGINDEIMRSSTDISIESALIPSNAFKLFMKQTILSHISDEYKQEEAITQLFCGHLFYQVIMRCKLRDRSYNNEQINIFVMDETIACSMVDYFNITDEHRYEVDYDVDKLRNLYNEKSKSRTNKSSKKINKKPAMTNAEKQKKYREKKKQINN